MTKTVPVIFGSSWFCLYFRAENDMVGNIFRLTGSAAFFAVLPVQVPDQKQGPCQGETEDMPARPEERAHGSRTGNSFCKYVGTQRVPVVRSFLYTLLSGHKKRMMPEYFFRTDVFGYQYRGHADTASDGKACFSTGTAYCLSACEKVRGRCKNDHQINAQAPE